jgi:ribosomal protein S18 acetylase RimI-like enzyme
VFDNPARGFYTVAELNGEIVGQMMITFEWSDWRNGWFWWVQSVYVREDARRGGVFRAIYRAIEAQAQADPTVIGLRLYFDTDNTRAQATYRALGMADTSYGMMETYPLPGRESHIG